MFEQLGLLTGLVYAVVETAEKFGLPRKYAHLLALPIGMLVSFLFLDSGTLINHIFDGVLIGFSAIAACDTVCNVNDIIRNK